MLVCGCIYWFISWVFGTVDILADADAQGDEEAKRDIKDRKISTE